MSFEVKVTVPKMSFLPWLCLVLISPAAVRAEQLPMSVFYARDGLAPTVTRILADSKGFIWFVQSEGLARFDGNGFRAFSEADGLPAGGTSFILERRDGTYWVAAGEQLCLFDPQAKLERFQCQSPNLGTINAILEDERTLWCGTSTGLWRRPAGGPHPWEAVRGIEPGASGPAAVYRLLKDVRGDLWATTISGLYRFRSNGTVDRWTPAHGLLIDHSTALSATPGTIWAGSQTRLFRFDIDPDTGDARIADRYDRSHGLPSGYVGQVAFWQGSAWAATFQGLARQAPSGRWETVNLDSRVDGLPIESLAVDLLGNLWVSASGGGVARIFGSGFSSFSERDGLGVRKVWSVFEDRNGVLTAVTKDEDHYFLNRFDGYRFHPVRLTLPFDSLWGWSWSQIVVHSSSGDWWLATGPGLLRYRKGLDSAPIVLAAGVGLPLANVFRIFEDSSGALWVSTGSATQNGLHRRNPLTSRLESFDESHGLPPLHHTANRPSVFAEDRAGQLWIGMLNGPLVRFRDGKFQQFPSTSGAPNSGVRALLLDRHGRLWIATRGRGLLRVDDPSSDDPEFSVYDKSSGLSSMNYDALAEDLEGRIYAAGGGGIDRLDPITGRVRRFTTADGLPPGALRVGFRDRKGALWFGGDHGLVRIEPQADRMEPAVVLVHAIRVNGQERRISDLGEVEPAVLSLSPSERQVQVDFGGFRHDLLYQTLLSGVDRDWTPASSSRSVHYLSLAPGSYELSIRAVTPEGVLSSQPARVRFHIATPVWLRWWFLLSCAAGIAALGYAGHRYRLAQAVALERLRTRIASDLHDDIGAGLSRIAVLSEVTRHEVGDRGSPVSERLETIARASRELVDSMSDIVWFVNPERDQLRDLIQRIRRFASDLFTSKGIEFTFRAPSDEHHSKIRADVRRHIYLICKESVNNIIRHSGCAKADIELRVESGWFVLTVKDDGRGFDPAEVDEGNGLANIRERARMLGGRLRVESGDGTGTTVSLSVPLGAAPKEHGGRLSGSRT